MSLILKEKSREFVLPNEGLHIARCYLLVDLGNQFHPYYKKTLPKILMGWEFPHELLDHGKPFIQIQRYTASLNEKANLRNLLESWRGRSFAPEELDGFALKKVLGVSCYVTTKQVINPNNNQRWSKVTSVCPLPEGVMCPPPINPSIHFDLDDYSESSYAAVPEGIRKIINLSDLQSSTGNPEAIASSVTYHPYDPDEPHPDVDL